MEKELACRQQDLQDAIDAGAPPSEIADLELLVVEQVIEIQNFVEVIIPANGC